MSCQGVNHRFTCSLKAHQWRHGAGSRPAARGQRLWEWWRSGPPSAPSWGRRSASWCRWSQLLSAGLSAYGTSDLAPPAKCVKDRHFSFWVSWKCWVHIVCFCTRWMSKPMARFSPLPSLGVALFSFCCKQISTSSSTFFTSNTYCREQKVKILLKFISHFNLKQRQ